MSHDPITDRWSARDFPVLLALARRSEEHGPDDVDLRAVATVAKLPLDQVERSFDLLEKSQYLEAVWGPMMLSGDRQLHAVDLTERGRRAVGIWPSATGADALIDALRSAEEATQDPEERSAIRRAWSALGSVSRDVLVDVTAAVIARQSGMG